MANFESERAVCWRPTLPGIEAISLRTAATFARHAHDAYGIGVVREGAQRSWSGRGHVEAGAGDIIMVNPGEIHDGAAIGGTARRWDMLYFRPSLVAQEIGARASSDLRPTVGDAMLARLFDTLFAVLRDPARDPIAAEQTLLATLTRAFARHGSRPLRFERRTPRVALARDWLDGNFLRRVSLADIAHAAGIGRFELVRGFAAAYGITPYAYVLQRRLGRAKALLADGASPAHAAHASGFADQSHLTRAFKRQFGVTPGQYRAACR